MSSFNKVILMGNLTRDPEVRYTPKGTPIAKLGLAANRQWKTDNGETREEVTFVDVDVFGRAAENCGQYLAKGRSVLVEGRLSLETWEDKNSGAKRSKLKVVAEGVKFLSSGKGQGAGGEGGEARAGSDPAPF